MLTIFSSTKFIPHNFYVLSNLLFIEDDVVKKVRGLRTQYAREKAKVAARAKEGHPLINPWTYYEALSFLDEFVSVKKNSDSNEPASELFHVSHV